MACLRYISAGRSPVGLRRTDRRVETPDVERTARDTKVRYGGYARIVVGTVGL